MVQAGNRATTVRLVGNMNDGNLALRLAAQLGQAKIEEKLSNMSRAVTKWEEDRLQKLLLQSAQHGRDGIVRQILHLHEVKADVRDSGRRTPLSHAAEMGHLNITRILSRSNADGELVEMQGQRPVDYAPRHGIKTHECICKDWMPGAEFYRKKGPEVRR